MRRACFLSGGGVKGAFQVGVLHQLMNQQIHFDKYDGISTGALQAAMMAQGSTLEEQMDQIGKLGTLYHSISGNDSIYTGPKTTLGKAINLVLREGLYNPSPLLKLIREHINPAKLRASSTSYECGVVELESGLYREIDPTIILNDESFLRFILASASMPGYFPAVPIRDEWSKLVRHYVDGGIRNVVPPLRRAVDFLRRGRDYDCELVIILTSPLLVQNKVNERWSALDSISRSVEIMVNEIIYNDLMSVLNKNVVASSVAHEIDQVRLAVPYKTINVKLYTPTSYYGDPLNFHREHITKMISDGYNAVPETLEYPADLFSEVMQDRAHDSHFENLKEIDESE